MDREKVNIVHQEDEIFVQSKLFIWKYNVILQKANKKFNSKIIEQSNCFIRNFIKTLRLIFILREIRKLFIRRYSNLY